MKLDSAPKGWPDDYVPIPDEIGEPQDDELEEMEEEWDETAHFRAPEGSSEGGQFISGGEGGGASAEPVPMGNAVERTLQAYGWSPTEEADAAVLAELADERMTALRTMGELADRGVTKTLEWDDLDVDQKDEVFDRWKAEHPDVVQQAHEELTHRLTRDTQGKWFRQQETSEHSAMIEKAVGQVFDSPWMSDDPVFQQHKEEIRQLVVESLSGTHAGLSPLVSRWSSSLEDPFTLANLSIPVQIVGDRPVTSNYTDAEQWVRQHQGPVGAMTAGAYLAQVEQLRVQSQAIAVVPTEEQVGQVVYDKFEHAASVAWARQHMGETVTVEAPSDIQVFDQKLLGDSSNYQRSTDYAQAMAGTRFHQLMQENGSDTVTRANADAFIRETWDSWKNSSSDPRARALKAAVAEELGTWSRDSVDLSRGQPDHLRLYARAQWETSQYLMEKAGVKELTVYRAVMFEGAKLGRATVGAVAMASLPAGPGGWPSGWRGGDLLTNLPLQQSALASFTLDRGVANGWDGVDTEHLSRPQRVVLRARVPAQAVFSLPVFGQRVHGEEEVVVMGVPWRSWDAWADKAPADSQVSFEVSHQQIPTRTRRRGKVAA